MIHTKLLIMLIAGLIITTTSQSLANVEKFDEETELYYSKNYQINCVPKSPEARLFDGPSQSQLVTDEMMKSKNWQSGVTAVIDRIINNSEDQFLSGAIYNSRGEKKYHGTPDSTDRFRWFVLSTEWKCRLLGPGL